MFLRKKDIQNLLIRKNNIVYVDLDVKEGLTQKCERPFFVLSNNVSNKFIPTLKEGI